MFKKREYDITDNIKIQPTTQTRTEYTMIVIFSCH
jgi:hypothetical protein